MHSTFPDIIPYLLCNHFKPIVIAAHNELITVILFLWLVSCNMFTKIGPYG